jgi:hypothetical protein
MEYEQAKELVSEFVTEETATIPENRDKDREIQKTSYQ